MHCNIKAKSTAREDPVARVGPGMTLGLRAERLEVRVGFCSERGRRPGNEDYGGIYLGTAQDRARYGVVAALADGVGGAKGGRVAAELCIRGFIDAYLSEAETKPVRWTGARALESINRWLHTIGRTDQALEGLACTFTALVLRGGQAHVIHLGDTRLYRLRDDRLVRLTDDHTLSGSGRNHILTRAVGLAASIQIEYAVEGVRIHDRFLLSSDGVHGVLSDRQISAVIARRDDPDESARRLVETALDAQSADNVTAIVIDLLGVPEPELADLALLADAQPIAPLPKSGMVVDFYRLDAVLSDGRYSRVFRAVDQATQQAVVIKFPKPAVGADAALRRAFLRESWIATRVRSPFVAESIEPAGDRRSRLYTVMPYYEGETLAQRLVRSPPVSAATGIDIAIKLAKGTMALHRIGIIHRDIKPENVLLLAAGGLKLIDLGVARLPHLEESPAAPVPGTPSYMAPELFAGAGGDELTDQFALGVTLYRMFTGFYPYGEIEPFSHPRFAAPIALATHRPDLPAWIDHVLAGTFARNRDERFGDLLELIFQLEQGDERGRPVRIERRPLYHRNPLRFWQIVSAILAASLIAALLRIGHR